MSNINYNIESPKEKQNRHKAMEAIKLLNTLRRLQNTHKKHGIFL